MRAFEPGMTLNKATVSLASEPKPVISMSKQVLLCCLTFLFFFPGSYLVLQQHEPPSAVSINAPANEFSSGRAMRHLQVIALAQHPTGSSANDEVRNYIMSVLSEMKMTPQIQKIGIRTLTGEAVVTVQNLAVRLEGEEPEGKAILLVAHYDSVPESYGASDNGAGVVTLLETLRALSSDRPLKRDVIALFTDAEELGLLGASAFVQQHEWAHDVGIVMNFDARGTRGPVFMFETSA